MISEHYLDDVLGCKTRYLSKGTGQPIVMLSGWLGTADNFIPIMEMFPEGYQCIALDLPGLGKTSPFTDRHHTVRNFSLFTEEFITKLGLPDPATLGISLGASIFLDYAENAKKQPYKTILQSPVYRPIPINRRAQLGLWAMNNLQAVAGAIFSLCSHKFFHRIIALCGDKNVKSITFETLSKYGTPGLPFYNVTATLEAVKDVINLDLEADLGKANRSVLLICGSDENLFPPNYEGGLASKLPLGEYKVVPGGTHYLFLQYPEKMLTIILDYLKRPV